MSAPRAQPAQHAPDPRAIPLWLRAGSTLVLLVYWMALAIATHVPSQDSTPASSPYGDKIEHFIAYAGLAFFISAASYLNLAAIRPLRTLLAVIVYGVVDEWLQQYVPTRVADGWDLLADAAGAVCGIALAAVAATVCRRCFAAR